VFSTSKKLAPWQITGGTEVEKGLALPIPNFGARCGWVIKATPKKVQPQEAEKIPIIQEAEGVPWNVWMSVKIISLSKLEPNTVQVPASHYTDCVIPTHWKVLGVINSSYIFLFELKIYIFRAINYYYYYYYYYYFFICFGVRFVTESCTVPWTCFENFLDGMRISFAAEIIWIGWYKEMLQWLVHYCSTLTSVDLKHESRGKIIITESNSLLISYFCYVGRYINNVIQSWVFMHV